MSAVDAEVDWVVGPGTSTQPTSDPLGEAKCRPETDQRVLRGRTGVDHDGARVLLPELLAQVVGLCRHALKPSETPP